MEGVQNRMKKWSFDTYETMFNFTRHKHLVGTQITNANFQGLYMLCISNHIFVADYRQGNIIFLESLIQLV